MLVPNDKILITESGGKTRWRYRCICSNCGVDRGYQRKRRVNQMCRTCASSITHKGKIVSEETRQKMKDNNYIKRTGNHPWTGHKHSEETKKRISEKQTQYCQEHGNQFSIGKSQGKHSHDTVCQISAKNIGKDPQWKGRVFEYEGPGGKMKLRSSYELFYAMWMDSQGIKWEYEPKFKLSNGKMFAPDFRLETGVIIEVKGYWTPIGKEKWELFCNDYPDIPKSIMMKDDLVSLGMKG